MGGESARRRRMPPRKGAWQPGRLRYGEMRNVYARRFRRGDYAKRFTRGGYAKHLRAARSGEADLLRGLVPDGLLLVLEGEGGHVAADGGLLADGRRRDGLFLALHAQNEVTEVSEDAVVGLVDVLAAEREGLAALDVFGRLAAVGLGGEGELIAVHDFDGAFVAEDLLAVTVVIVAEVTRVIDVEFTVVLVDGAEGIGHVAVVGLIGPAVNAAARHAGLGQGLIEHEVDDVGLVDEEVCGDAAGVIPVEAPLEVALRIPVALGGGAEEAIEIGVLRRGFGGDDVAPGGIVGEGVAIPESADVVDVADHALLDEFVGLLIERGTAVLGADLAHLPGLPPDLDEVEALFDGVGEGFFEVDVFASPERGDGHIVVQVLRGHDIDRIDRLVGEQFAVIDEGLGLITPDGLHAVEGAGDVALVGIADGRDLDFIGSRCMEPVETSVATGTDADPADIHFFIGALSRDHGWASGDRGRLEEITPIEFVRHGTSNSDIPDDSSGTGRWGRRPERFRVRRAKISPLLKGRLLILKELRVRARQKRAKISPFFQILRIEFPGRSSRLPLIM